MVYNFHKDNYKERSPSMYKFAGDSSNHSSHTTEKEVDALMVPENVKTPLTTVGNVNVAENLDKPNMEPNHKELDSLQQSRDNIDSVYLRPRPPDKNQSNESINTEKEDCGITCLYYVMQCCNCSIM